jgi:hypothetical protein
MLALLFAMQLVSSVGNVDTPEIAKGLDVKATSAALLLVILWGLGHYWMQRSVSSELFGAPVNNVDGQA